MSLQYIIGGKRKSQGKKIKLGFTCASFQGDFLHRVYTGELGWGVGKSCSPGKHQKSPKRVNGGELC